MPGIARNGVRMGSHVASVPMERSREWAVIMTRSAAVALDDVEVTALEELIGLLSPGEPFRTQGFACGDLVGKCDRVFRWKVFAVRHEAVVSTPPSRWNPLPENMAQGCIDVFLRNEFRDHRTLSVCKPAFQP